MIAILCICIRYYIRNTLGLQNSKFLQFVSKMSRGELIIDDNQVKPAASGDWAAEYQQQYTGGPSWADEFAHNQASIELYEA